MSADADGNSVEDRVEVVKRVAAASGRRFTSDKHQRAWKMHGARPRTNAPDPAATDKRYSVYHPPYGTYTYSQAWVDFLSRRSRTTDAGPLCPHTSADPLRLSGWVSQSGTRAWYATSAGHGHTKWRLTSPRPTSFEKRR